MAVQAPCRPDADPAHLTVGGEPLDELANRLQVACLASGSTVALAESCTGGLVAAALTEIAGSSGYFVGGVVAYSNDAKRDLLGVDEEVLAAHGAVSAQAGRAMAVGARGRFGGTLAAAGRRIDTDSPRRAIAGIRSSGRCLLAADGRAG